MIAVAAGAPGELADRWQEFKQPVDPGGGTARFESTAGNGRYQAWQAALDANATDPLVGIGPGTYEYWWAREGTVSDLHSRRALALSRDPRRGRDHRPRSAARAARARSSSSAFVSRARRRASSSAALPPRRSPPPAPSWSRRRSTGPGTCR